MKKIKETLIIALLIFGTLYGLMSAFTSIFFNENFTTRRRVERALDRNISYISELFENERALGNENPFPNTNFFHLIDPFV